MKFKTVRDGEKAVVFSHLGEGTLLDGPQRVFLYRKRFRLLESATADRFGYVEVHKTDGTIEHQPGPSRVFHNPLVYTWVQPQEAHKVDANHVLVVYARLKGGDSQRRIIQGPALFVPQAEEWIHEFVWHGTDLRNKTRMIPGHDKFTMLPTIPRNFYYNVREVRTSDDTMLTVKVMLFYHMVDVLKMLDTTHDPIADLMNALCADVITFVGPLAYKDFVAKTELLSDLVTYPQLQQRAERVGFKVQKVVYRGYHASEQHQQMQNEAIESRTQLRLQREIQEQQQRLVNFKLTKEQERSTLAQAMELKRQSHTQRLQELKHQHTLELGDLKNSQRLELDSQESELKLAHQTAQNQHKLDHLQHLAQAHVDLTSYLKLKNPPAVQEEIRVTSY